VKDKYVFPFEELGKDDWATFGKKCANLGEMTRIGMPVPSGFALTIECHRRFMEETRILVEIERYLSDIFPKGLKNIQDYQQASTAICSIVESKAIPKEIQDEVLSAYADLCKKSGKEKVAVAVRSAGAKSHPGRYDTFLNVNGETEVLRNIVKVWSSAFNTRSIAAVSKEGLSVTDSPPIGTAVQRIIPARAAGVCFTVHPVTGDLSKIVLESSWGFGESVVGGTTSPDKHIIDKGSLEILWKEPGAKTIQIVCSKEGNTVEQEVTAENQLAFCLEDGEAKKVAEFGIALEAHFNVPQDMEWAIDSTRSFPDNLFLLQTRPVTTVKQSPSKKKTSELIIDLMLSRMFEYKPKDENLLKGLRILIVDDEPDVLDTLEQLLTMCSVEKATSFDEAKQLLEDKYFDMAILDIMGVDGYKLLEISNKRNVIAVMFTAHALSLDNIIRSYEEGAASYVPKEEIAKITTFLTDILEAKSGGKHFWWRWHDRLDTFLERRFGRDWQKKHKEFWRDFPSDISF
jgi:pyruvate,water dikinase